MSDDESSPSSSDSDAVESWRTTYRRNLGLSLAEDVMSTGRALRRRTWDGGRSGRASNIADAWITVRSLRIHLWKHRTFKLWSLQLKFRHCFWPARPVRKRTKKTKIIARFQEGIDQKSFLDNIASRKNAGLSRINLTIASPTRPCRPSTSES